MNLNKVKSSVNPTYADNVSLRKDNWSLKFALRIRFKLAWIFHTPASRGCDGAVDKGVFLKNAQEHSRYYVTKYFFEKTSLDAVSIASAVAGA